MDEYIKRSAIKYGQWAVGPLNSLLMVVRKKTIDSIPAADVVEVVHGYHEGDVCIYGFGHENKSRAIVEIVRILDDERGVAEIKFHKVFVDDTGNGLFDYLLKTGGTMNASFQYLKNITPRMDGGT